MGLHASSLATIRFGRRQWKNDGKCMQVNFWSGMRIEKIDFIVWIDRIERIDFIVCAGKEAALRERDTPLGQCAMCRAKRRFDKRGKMIWVFEKSKLPQVRLSWDKSENVFIKKKKKQLNLRMRKKDLSPRTLWQLYFSFFLCLFISIRRCE